MSNKTATIRNRSLDWENIETQQSLLITHNSSSLVISGRHRPLLAVISVAMIPRKPFYLLSFSFIWALSVRWRNSSYIYIYIYILYVCLSISLSIYLSICLPVRMRATIFYLHMRTCVFIYLSIHLYDEIKSLVILE